MTCEEVRLALGAHALGALEPDEAEEIDTHLATCEACGAELLELEGVAGFLGKVSERDVALVASPPRQVLDRLLNDRARRHRRGRLMLAVAASAAVLVVGGTVWSVVQQPAGDHASVSAPAADSPEEVAPYLAPDDDARAESEASRPPDRSERQARQTPRPSRSEAASLLKTDEGGEFSGADGDRQATVTASPAGGGTDLLVRVTGVPLGTTCRLLVVGANGESERTQSWTVSRETYEDKVAFPRETGIAMADIVRFEVVDATGRTLVTVPVRK
ncbi:anti-sigma factor family protein [Nonomuraea sp. LPB2021202275-12-8]|uniref:anti-sigma factor family protein n=1 Tax=Nonomuraea sp. LPB2021202275-12-8 TaxID=3120159 RepID=UPI00300DAD43